jgi:hypothetical protein
VCHVWLVAVAERIPFRPSRNMSGKMTQDDASRIASTQAQGGKDMSSGGFAARAQSAGDTNAKQASGGKGGQGAEQGGEGKK